MPEYFFCQLTEGKYINVIADRMELKDNMIFAWDGDQLAAAADISCVLHAHICRKREDDLFENQT